MPYACFGSYLDTTILQLSSTNFGWSPVKMKNLSDQRAKNLESMFG